MCFAITVTRKIDPSFCHIVYLNQERSLEDGLVGKVVYIYKHEENNFNLCYTLQYWENGNRKT